MTQPAAPDDPVGVVLAPGTRLLWRGNGAAHLQAGSRSVVVEGLPAPLLAHIAGARVADPAAVLAGPLADPQVTAALDDLVADGYLWPSGDDADDLRRYPTAPRLAGELTALSVRHGEQAAELLAARRHAAVVVAGTGRVAVHLAAVLAAAGVGRVSCPDAGRIRLQHTVPGGLAPADEGRERVVGAQEALRRAAPEVDTTPLPADTRPELIVLAHDAPVDDDRRAALHAAGAAHLLVTLGTDHGGVGPLVLPGLTTCLRCVELHRRERDPAWPALALQLSVGRRYGPASDVALATIVAGLAAQQALAFLDGAETAAVEGSLEVHLPDWRVRRRSLRMHPRCDCAPGGPDV